MQNQAKSSKIKFSHYFKKGYISLLLFFIAFSTFQCTKDSFNLKQEDSKQEEFRNTSTELNKFFLENDVSLEDNMLNFKSEIEI